MFGPVQIDPHGGCATDGDRHDEEIDNRDSCADRDNEAKAQVGPSVVFKILAHDLETNLVIVIWIVTVLNGSHPGT